MSNRLLLILGLAAALAAPSSHAHADKAQAHYRQGLALKQQGKTDEAIAELEKAVAARGNHGMAWASLGHLYKQRGDIDKAVTAYENATQHIEKDAILWSNLGMAYYRAGRDDDALRALEKSCRLDSGKNADVQANMGAIWRKKGNEKAAIFHLRRAVALDPKDPVYASNLGVALRHAGQNDEAGTYFRKAIELDPDVAIYHYNLAGVHRRAEEVDKAIEEYLITVKLDASLAEAWYDLGHMYRLNHDNDKAVDAFKRYLSLTEGKDREADARVRDQIESLGGEVDAPRKRKRRR